MYSKKISEKEFMYNETYNYLDRSMLTSNFNETDYQGINWLELTNRTRSNYRSLRNNQFTPYLSHDPTANLTKYPYKTKLKKDSIYKYNKFYKNLPLKTGHFQLRYNLCATSYHDLYYTNRNEVNHYCTLRNAIRKFYLPNFFSPTCLSVLDDFFLVGGLNGDIYLYNKKTKNLIFNGQITNNNESHIINSAKLYIDNKGSINVLTASNDGYVRIFDLYDIKTVKNKLKLDSAVNFAIFSPDKNLLATYSDQKEAEIYDMRAGEQSHSLKGHEDYGFGIDWHPNGLYLATGNQDSTCRIWDIRNTKNSLEVLQGEIGSVYSVKYSFNGNKLVFGECIDYVNIYNVKNNYKEYQSIDFFGELVGFDFSPNESENLFIGVNINEFNGIFEFKLKEAEIISDISNVFI